MEVGPDVGVGEGWPQLRLALKGRFSTGRSGNSQWVIV